jgi:hypothetical protein
VSLDPAIFRALVANGATPEMLLAVVEASASVDEARLEKKRANNAERQARYRERHQQNNADNALQGVIERDSVTSPAPSPSFPPDPQTNPIHTPVKTTRARKGPVFSLPSDIPEEEWEGFEEMRRRIGKPMTDKARSLAVVELRKLSDAGWPPGDVLNHSTMNSYQGLFPPKDRQNGKRPANDRRQRTEYRDPILGDAFDELSASMGQH